MMGGGFLPSVIFPQDCLALSVPVDLKALAPRLGFMQSVPSSCLTGLIVEPAGEKFPALHSYNGLLTELII